MPGLVIIAVLLAVACAANAVLLAAANRRLDLHAELLWPTHQRGVPAKALPVGAAVGPFGAVDTEGTAVGGPGWAAATLVVFLSPTCPSCRRLRGRELRQAAARWPGGRAAVVVVVTGPTARAGYARRLAPVARIVVDRSEAVRAAFGVQAFPALFVVDGAGVLSWTGLHAYAVPGADGPPR